MVIKVNYQLRLHDICKEFNNISASPEIHYFVHTYRTQFALCGAVARVSGSQLRGHNLNRVPSTDDCGYLCTNGHCKLIAVWLIN